MKNILIIKVGTSTLTKTSEKRLELDIEALERIGTQIAHLTKEGSHIAIISSGAITAGMMVAGFVERPAKSEMPELQRLASIGWRHVLNAWQAVLPNHLIGELLFTKHEFTTVTERNEALRTAFTLWKHGDILIGNENDAITHEEIAFGDNDTLAAIFAAGLKNSSLFTGTVKLVVLSDVDGVYQDIKNKDSIIPTIDDVEAYKHIAGNAGSANGTGGMTSKFNAAKIAVENGVEMYIANGRTVNAIQRTLDGEIGTKFVAQTN